MHYIIKKICVFKHVAYNKKKEMLNLSQQGILKMTRLFSFIFPLILIIVIPVTTIALEKAPESIECLRCHEEVYMKAVSNPYRHSVVIKKCPFCHIAEERQDKTKLRLNFSTLQREWVVYMDELSEDQKYQAEVVVTDRTDRSCSPKIIDIIPGEIWKHSKPRPSLKLNRISEITVEEIKKRAFVQAVISWYTDAFATSEIEYRLKGGRGGRIRQKDIFTKEHRVILSGLKHKSLYYFRIISRDVYGNLVESRDYPLDTSKEFTRIKESINYDSILPSIEALRVFRTTKNKGLYLKVVANKPSTLSVTVKEAFKPDKNHGFGLLPERYAKIDICYKCHPHDTSHPVGVKSEGPRIKIPEELPTIEGGIITCVTCHNPHGGKRVYFTRMDFKKDICILCHIGGY
jgi:predicted CXXCH cytochrome family protein